MKQQLLYILLFISVASHATTDSLKYAFVSKDGYWKAIDTTGKILADSLVTEDNKYFSWILSVNGNEGLFPFILKGSLGFKNRDNNVVIPACYSQMIGVGRLLISDDLKTGGKIVPCFYKGQSVIKSKNNKCGVIDYTGNLVIDTTYDYISNSDSNDVYVARLADNIKLIDREGWDIIPFRYKTDTTYCLPPQFGNGLLPVMIKNEDANDEWNYGIPDTEHNYKVGFINTSGKLVIDTKYPFNVRLLYDVTANEIHVRGNNWCGTAIADAALIEKNIKPEEHYYRFEDGLCLVRKGDKDVVISVNGESLFQVNGGSNIKNTKGFIVYWSYSDNGLSLSTMNYLGEIVPNKVYDPQHGRFDVKRSSDANSGLVAFRKDMKWGYKNARGEVIIPPIYNRVLPFQTTTVCY